MNEDQDDKFGRQSRLRTVLSHGQSNAFHSGTSSSPLDHSWNSDRPVQVRGKIASSASMNLSAAQEKVATVLDSRSFEFALAIVVMLNLVVVVFETDMEATNGEVEAWVVYSSYSILMFFCIELIAKLYVLHKRFFRNALNVFEFSLVLSDVLAVCLQSWIGKIPAFSLLRVLRLLRLLRAVRLMILFRELYMILNGIIGATRAVVWALLMVGLLLTLFSVVAVDVIHPLNMQLVEVGFFGDCERCGRAFSSVYHSNLTLFQLIILGDAWDETSLPILENFPMSLFFFVPAWVLVQLGLLNLILAVIMEQAMEAREQDVSFRLSMKQRELMKSRERLKSLWKRLDRDGDGYVNRTELYNGYQDHEDVRNAFNLMDVGVDDLDMVFTLIDRDHSGFCSYKEFIEELYKLKAHDTRTLLMFTKWDLVQSMSRLEQNQAVLLKNVQASYDRLRDSLVADSGDRGRMAAVPSFPDVHRGSNRSKWSTSTEGVVDPKDVLVVPGALSTQGLCSKQDDGTEQLLETPLNQQDTMDLSELTANVATPPVREVGDVLMHDCEKDAPSASRSSRARRDAATQCDETWTVPAANIAEPVAVRAMMVDCACFERPQRPKSREGLPSSSWRGWDVCSDGASPGATTPRKTPPIYSRV